MPGRFITFEGGEGTGKSTQTRLLNDALRQAGIDVMVTREPGGAAGAEEIRQVLLTGGAQRWDPVSESLLHMAARRAHLARTVMPALAGGRWVVSDRYVDSTYAYQGYGHGLPLDDLRALYRFVAGDFLPDLTIVFDLDPKIGLDRAQGRGEGWDRYEALDLSFHQRVRDGFLALARSAPERCAVIDASRSVEAVRRDVASLVASRLDAAIA